MNCLNNKKNNKNTSCHGSGHSMWFMVLCCGAPIILLAAVSLLGAGFNGIKIFLAGIIPYLCPVMMLAMLPMMLSGRRKTAGRENDEANTKPYDKGKNNN